MFLVILLAAMMILYFLAIMPRMYKRPDYTPLKRVLYAHRGLYDNENGIPENTLLGFKRAVEAGYGIELDVQLTKDEVAVVFHDETLERMCHKEGKVRDFTYEELNCIGLLGTQEKIPKLEEVLAVVGGRVPLIVEIKMYTAATLVCQKANAILKGYTGIYCMESFHPLAVMWYRQNRPDIVRGQLSSNFQKEMGKETLAHFIVHHLLTNFISKPDFIAYCHLYKRGLSRTICQKFYKSLSVTWTIRSEAELKEAESAFDVFIFENFTPRVSESR